MKNQLLAVFILLFSVVSISSAEEKKKINSFGDKSHKYSTFKKSAGKTKSDQRKRPKLKKNELDSRKKKQPNPIPVDLIRIDH